MVKSLANLTLTDPDSQNLADCGWRMESVLQPDGTTKEIQVPLTDLEFLHPQEGYHLPNSTFHGRIVGDARDILTRRYDCDLEVTVFGDLIIERDLAQQQAAEAQQQSADLAALLVCYQERFGELPES
jgi:ssRNA-specific RNase YbeY (16S rRNA maturation enzyme)